MRKVPSDMVAGTRRMTNNFGELEIVEYIDKKNIRVRFVVTKYECTASANSIRRGSVKDKYMPFVCGVGFIGEGEFEPSTNRRATGKYEVWADMIKRCYYHKRQIKSPTYIGCSVCVEWHNFQVFAKWMSEQDHDGKQLDKDIKVKGNKVYSPETCMFVTHAENTAEAKAKHYEFVSPDGVKEHVYNLRKFCLEHNLNRGNMCSVHLGDRKQHKGWTKA